MPHNLRNLGRFAVLLAIVVQAGCARVTVKKVPTPTQYGHWTDRMQRKADKMEGIRFYLPRPFVQVRQSFPIRSESFLVHGQVSADGQYIIVGEVAANSGLAKYVATSTGVANVPRRDIIVSTEIPGAQAGNGDGDDDDKNEFNTGLSSTVINEEIVIPAPPKPATPPSSPNLFQKLTGINERKTTNDNGAVAVQPLRGNNFDIVYMPDFEEQYVVSSKSGLGNARFEVNLGQGWSLQGFNSLTDNSELNKRIFDLIDSSTAIAEQLALKKFGLNLPDLPAGQANTIRAQAGDAPDKGGVPGTDVTLKVTIIHYAAKGLYPVLKPREVQERLPAQEISYSYLDLFKLKARTSGVSDFDPTALKRAQMATSNESTSFTIPKYPYQFISFNTFSYMAIEAIHNSTHPKGPFEHLYPPSGTADRSDPNEKVPPPITVVPKSGGGAGAGSGSAGLLPASDRVKAAMDEIKKKLEFENSDGQNTNPYVITFESLDLSETLKVKLILKDSTKQPVALKTKSEVLDKTVYEQIIKVLPNVKALVGSANVTNKADLSFDDAEPDPMPNPDGASLNPAAATIKNVSYEQEERRAQMPETSNPMFVTPSKDGWHGRPT